MPPLLLILAQNAPTEQIDTPLEYWFGAMAAIALVVTWLWLWLKIRGKVREGAPQVPTENAESK